MNTRRALANIIGPIAHHVEFNNDRKFFSVALEDGFSIFTAETCELYLQQDSMGSIGSATMLESSQILGLISGGRHPKEPPTKMIMFDTIKQEISAAITTSNPIIRTRLTDNHIALVFERSVNLYKHQPTLEKIGTYETSQNRFGICCLGKRFIAFPGRTSGQIQLVDLSNLRVTIIPAHTAPLRALELSPDGEVVASGSENGTLIRIHATNSSARLGELRRGVGSATIFSIAISPSNTHLAVTSDTFTLHIFDLPHPSNLVPAIRSSSPMDKNWQNVERSPSPPSGSNQPNKQKWGSLAKLPFAPRVFSDLYSFASTTFDPGAEEKSSHDGRTRTIRGVPGGKPPKGIVGWINNQTLAIISGGDDARYERFALTQDDHGKTICVRVGWSRFMRPN